LSDKGRYAGCLDVDGVYHDFGYSYVNLPALAEGLGDKDKAVSIYNWLEKGITSSGKADAYSRWVFAPRFATVYNPKRNSPQTPVHSWWIGPYGGEDFDAQIQNGGAILFLSYYDIMARARYLGADNAWKRFTEILDRYDKPDHLSGGTPLFMGEVAQGGPGSTSGSVGTEGEFPESGLVPVSFLYAFLGIDSDINGLKVRPNLPKSLTYAGVRNLRYRGRMYDIRVRNSTVSIDCTSAGSQQHIEKKLAPGEVFRLN
jgi:hypothetical protein